MAIHKVRPSDNLSKIAKMYNVRVSDLVKANNLTNPDHIEVGQEIKIPDYFYTREGKRVSIASMEQDKPPVITVADDRSDLQPQNEVEDNAPADVSQKFWLLLGASVLLVGGNFLTRKYAPRGFEVRRR